MKPRINNYVSNQLDVSKEEYIKIEKYIRMRNNAEPFLRSHCKGYWPRISDNIKPSDNLGSKITTHTLELANIQKDVLKILNKKNDRGFIYESELLCCFAYSQYPNILTEQFESDQEIIIPEQTKPKPYNYIPIIIVVSIVIAFVVAPFYLLALLIISF